ncbi:hypothetical protein GC173_14760 [bacterium]|nr:hypothetical protein [bacterium]
MPEVPIGFDVIPPPTRDKYPCLNERQYEWILTALRSSGTLFEQHPRSYSEMPEPTLRDFMLQGLNNGPGMQPSAEKFRCKGKTDICLEFSDYSAFIAECKNWGGERVVHDALSQLLGYLTWRDCKAALVIFNLSVAGFSEIQAKLLAALQSHPHFVQEIPGSPMGEWRVVVKSPDDPARQITVHVFLFNLFTRKEAP